MIEFSNVSKSFDGTNILEKINFSVGAGEKVSLIGPGASGKSTIIKLLLGVIQPDEGDIRLLGTDMVNTPERSRLETLKSLGMSFQQGALFDFMTVEENLNFAMANMTEFSLEEMERRVISLLDTVKLGRTRDMFPYELSGGMQRRVGVARAVTTDPKLAIFDEPTSGLDPVTSTIILNMINDLVSISDGKSMVVVTSSVEIAIRFAERVIIVNDGHIVGDGPWKDLILNGTDWVKNFLSVRLIGIDLSYAKELGLPDEFIKAHF